MLEEYKETLDNAWYDPVINDEYSVRDKFDFEFTREDVINSLNSLRSGEEMEKNLNFLYDVCHNKYFEDYELINTEEFQEFCSNTFDDPTSVSVDSLYFLIGIITTVEDRYDLIAPRLMILSDLPEQTLPSFILDIFINFIEEIMHNIRYLFIPGLDKYIIRLLTKQHELVSIDSAMKFVTLLSSSPFEFIEAAPRVPSLLVLQFDKNTDKVLQPIKNLLVVPHAFDTFVREKLHLKLAKCILSLKKFDLIPEISMFFFKKGYKSVFLKEKIIRKLIDNLSFSTISQTEVAYEFIFVLSSEIPQKLVQQGILDFLHYKLMYSSFIARRIASITLSNLLISAENVEGLIIPNWVELLLMMIDEVDESEAILILQGVRRIVLFDPEVFIPIAEECYLEDILQKPFISEKLVLFCENFLNELSSVKGTIECK